MNGNLRTILLVLLLAVILCVVFLLNGVESKPSHRNGRLHVYCLSWRIEPDTNNPATLGLTLAKPNTIPFITNALPKTR